MEPYYPKVTVLTQKKDWGDEACGTKYVRSIPRMQYLSKSRNKCSSTFESKCMHVVRSAYPSGG